jgi:hypothetical protein
MRSFILAVFGAWLQFTVLSVSVSRLSLSLSLSLSRRVTAGTTGVRKRAARVPALPTSDCDPGMACVPLLPSFPLSPSPLLPLPFSSPSFLFLSTRARLCKIIDLRVTFLTSSRLGLCIEVHWYLRAHNLFCWNPRTVRVWRPMAVMGWPDSRQDTTQDTDVAVAPIRLVCIVTPL